MANGKSTTRHPPIRKGETFGRWTAIEDQQIVLRGKYKTSMVLCQCSCEQATVRLVSRSSLLCSPGSCGCLNREKARQRHLKHGLSTTGEYRVWSGIKSRCFNQNSAHYADYGGRGITMCQRWRDSFENFFADMGARPDPKMEVERLNNSLGYSPDNCAWRTHTVQMRNTRKTVFLTYQGITDSAPGWAERTGLSEKRIRTRKRMGWSDEKTLTTPVRPKTIVMVFRGESATLEEWCKRLSLHPNTVHGRLDRGMTDEQALATPVLPRTFQTPEEKARPRDGRHSSRNRMLTCDGETMCAVAWAERLGVSEAAIHQRLKRGWTDEKTIKTPMGVKHRRKK